MPVCESWSKRRSQSNLTSASEEQCQCKYGNLGVRLDRWQFAGGNRAATGTTDKPGKATPVCDGWSERRRKSSITTSQ